MPTNALKTSRVIYKTVPRFPNTRVGSDGSLWGRSVFGAIEKGRARKLGNWKQRNITPRTKDGYILVRLRYAGKTWVTQVQGLVLSVFRGAREGGQIACHRNDVPWDNRLKNLYWGTVRSNCKDSEKNGRGRKGEMNGHCKLTVAGVREIRSAYRRGVASRVLAEQYGVHYSQICRVAKGAGWSHVK